MTNWSKVQKFIGNNKDVTKYVFENDTDCVEAVLYKYNSYIERTVLCISTQCGCPVGCVFCGTGKKFISNLTAEEITSQATYIINEIEQELNICLNDECKKLQIMFMSMGEPMLNWYSVAESIEKLSSKYPNAALLISTVGISNRKTITSLINLSKNYNKVGLQFSVHDMREDNRSKLIPYKNKLSIYDLRDVGLEWWKETNRQVYLNFCVTENNKIEDYYDILPVFSKEAFALTFSVVCDVNKNSSNKDEIILINKLIEYFLGLGYNVRKFDPAGQDDIGAGCGQLWYVQDWMKGREV